MSRIEAAVADEQALRHLLDRLAARVSLDLVEVRSSSPLHHDPIPGPPRRRWVLWAAITGALVGGAGTFWLAAATAQNYPLVTGGMPILSGPPLGIITYEGTALGLILATLLAVVVRARLLRRVPPSALAHHLAEGRIVVSLPGEDDGSLERLLHEAGALEVAWTGSWPDS